MTCLLDTNIPLLTIDEDFSHLKGSFVDVVYIL